MIFRKKRGGEVEMYRRADADALGIQYVPWREARGDGQWVLSDDGFVLKTKFVREIVEKHGLKVRKRYRVVTPLAVRYAHGRAPMEIGAAIDAKNWGLTTQEWYQEFNRKHPALLHMLMTAVVNGRIHMSEWRRYTRDEYSEFIRIAKHLEDPSYEMTWYQVRCFFNHQGVRKMIKNEIAKKARERGYTVDKVFDLLQEVEVLARSKQDPKTLLALTRDLAAITGISGALKQAEEKVPELPGSDDQFDEILNRKAVKDAQFSEINDVSAE